MTHQEKSESAKKAELNSTIIEFYNRCCQSAEVKRPWDTLHPQVMQQFTQAVAYMHRVVYNGG